MNIFIIKVKMKDLIKERLNEELTKSYVKNEISKFINSAEFQNKINSIIKDKIKHEKYLEDKVVDITKNVMTQLFKTFWTKRSFWTTQLKNKKS